jgi:hypothetical protein
LEQGILDGFSDTSQGVWEMEKVLDNAFTIYLQIDGRRKSLKVYEGVTLL